MNPNSCGCLSRRHFINHSTFALGALGLHWLLSRDGHAKPIDMEQRHYDTLPKQPHFQPRARAMISMFMQGGPSHIDLFDPKPEIGRAHV